MAITQSAAKAASSANDIRTYLTTSIWVPRLALGFILTTGIFLPSLYDPLLSRTYTILYNSPIYRFSFIETVETVFFYALIEVLYTIKFVNSPSQRLALQNKTHQSPKSHEKPRLPRGMRRPSRRMPEIGLYILPLLTLDLTMVKKYAHVPVSQIRASANYAPSPSPRDNPISASFLLPTFHNFSPQSPLQLWRALPCESPSSRRLLLELLAAFLIYDALFFAAHLAFHKLPFLAPFHRPHHRHAEMNPQITNQLSVVERLALVLLANFALNVIGAHVLTRTLFVPLFVALLVDIHSGLDLQWSYEKVLPRGWGAGAGKHARHHRDGGMGYEPFFTWCDAGWEWVEGCLAGKKDAEGS